ncbi:MAG: lactate 2-monooxygenase [Solirubrobacteraceae bacterium]|nr:lactate 2-monooxygenase [Solirubrobacteraceae bacterium]
MGSFLAMTDPVGPFSDWQYGIYLRGMGMGERPELPVAWDALERAAYDALDEAPRGYVWGGAGTGDTMRANLDALRAWRIVPRHLRAVEARDLSAEVLGSRLPAPLALAPIGVQSIVHPEGELASARAAAAVGVPYTASTAAAHTMEEIASAGGERWYQLYWPKDEAICASLVKRAEAAGYTAIVVTLDTFFLGWRPTDLAQGFLPFLRGEGIAQFLSDPVFRAQLARPPEEDLQAAVGHWVSIVNKVVQWEDLAWLRGITELPIVLKGVLHRDDARRAVAAGMDGVVVSNHGGRQVDGAVAALDALVDVADEIGGDATVLFDSGIRCGADVVKALCLGADAVLLGRPFLWGLALAGADGVEHVLRMLLAEVDLTMALSGAATVADLTPELLRRA